MSSCWTRRGGHAVACDARAATEGCARRLPRTDFTIEPCPQTRGIWSGNRDIGLDRGKNLQIEFRSGRRKLCAVAGFGAGTHSLECRRTSHSWPAGSLAAKGAASTVPIVVTAVGDVLALGLAESFVRPGGNVTGLSLFVSELTAKRLELIKEAVPSLTKRAVLLNPDDTFHP